MQTYSFSKPQARGWFACSKTRSVDVRVRLFCFAHAGGDGRAFLPWELELPKGVEVIGVSLPGRGSRICEKSLQSIPQLVAQLTREIEPYGTVPCYFFGHSFGGILAFALACGLRRELPGFPLRGLILSSCRAPHLGPPYSTFLHELDRDSFFTELRKFNGLPDDIFAKKGMIDWIEPPLRADIKALELWVHSVQTESLQLSVPIYAVGGCDDAAVPASELAEWRRCSTAFHSVLLAEGGHFYFSENPRPLFDVLRVAISPSLESSPTWDVAARV